MIVDGLNVSQPSRRVLETLQAAGVAAVHFTAAGVWAGFPESLQALLGYRRLVEENSDLTRLVLAADDIATASAEGKVGVILGWQNSGGFDDYLPYVEMFQALGLRVVQLTYNTANAVGSGCYESRDGGLTDFGREFVTELNRVGILVDLSHAGRETAMEAVEASRRPVAFTHTLPAAIHDHPRNRTDEELIHVTSRGGFVGATCYPGFMRSGSDATVADYLEAIEYLVDLVGEDAVGIATDFTDEQPAEFWDYIGKDKGYGRFVVRNRAKSQVLRRPAGLASNQDIAGFAPAMRERSWPEPLIEKVLGANWVRFLGDSWGPRGRLDEAAADADRRLRDGS